MTGADDGHRHSTEGNRRPGMVDVARLAGVSHQTVSRVLNEHPSVRPGTRDKVLRAARQLGYRRNMSARALATRHSRTIGAVTTSSAHIGPTSTMNAVEVAARGRGYATQLLTVDQESDATEAFLHLAEREVEGVVIVASRVWLAEAAAAAGPAVPVVMIAASRQAPPSVHLVSVDQELGARMAVRHLLTGGRRRVAHVSGPADWFDAIGRLRGWREELDDAGLEPGALVRGNWSARSGFEAGVQLCEREGPLPDAVFVANDQMALGLLRALADRGVRVPDDVAVVGFDDIDGTEYYTPSLTTVRQPFPELGKVAMEVLASAMGGSGAVRSTIAPTLVVRESSRRTG